MKAIDQIASPSLMRARTSASAGHPATPAGPDIAFVTWSGCKLPSPCMIMFILLVRAMRSLARSSRDAPQASVVTAGLVADSPQGRPKIAHRFNGGPKGQTRNQVPSGTKEALQSSIASSYSSPCFFKNAMNSSVKVLVRWCSGCDWMYLIVSSTPETPMLNAP
jgi:hypothetical protein